MTDYGIMECMPKVFINFRGRDQAGYAVLLDRELTEQFGYDQIFLSSRSIRPGDNFVSEIIRNLRLCEVVLVVIGPDWLAHGFTSSPSRGGRVDWVYHEIAEALTAGIRVIPVLVEGAAMPSAADLPPTIAGLSSCQYLRLHHRNIPHDMARIVEEIAILIRRSPIRRRGRPAGLDYERFLEFLQISRCQASFSGIVGYCGSGSDGADLRRAGDIHAIITALREAKRLTAADRFVRRFAPAVGLSGPDAQPRAKALLAAAADYLAVRPDSAFRVIYFLAYAHAELRAFEDFLATEGLLASPGGLPASSGPSAPRDAAPIIAGELGDGLDSPSLEPPTVVARDCAEHRRVQ
jgi:hypothetical protein